MIRFTYTIPVLSASFIVHVRLFCYKYLIRMLCIYDIIACNDLTPVVDISLVRSDAT